VVSLLSKLRGSATERTAKKLQPFVAQINALEEKITPLSQEEMREYTQELCEQAREGERAKKNPKLDTLLPEAFALVREATWRTLDKRQFDVQLMGGIVLHQGNIAEMKTGEGKTFVAPLAAYLNALEGRGVHVITVNDYLARRDAGWMGQVFHYLGLTVGCLQHDAAFLFDPEWEGDVPMLRPAPRQDAYAADITYGTNNEFGFDYLRDNMARDTGDKVQRELRFAIVDEVDNILIDEARTPLIISGQAEQNTEVYYQYAQLASQLQEERDYTINLKHRNVNLTEDGIGRVERLLRVPEGESMYDPRFFEATHYLDNALKAKSLYLLDREYAIVDGQVIIVDEFTGRYMYGRRYSEGLHQAIEAKERLRVERESQTLATITIQNYFRMYDKIAGMTGTAATEAEEFGKIYNMDVVQIPTNRDMIRADYADRIYKTEEAKYRAVAEEIEELNASGRPVLVGTTSIEKSERLSTLLSRRGVKHQVLNARHHEREAAIVAEAGQPGAVTIATNMAGRGTDIILGDGVAGEGGLHIIGTERHESRRIDNQLRGRAGRQGDPGSSRFYVSLEDELMVRFGLDRVKGVMERLGVDEDTPIENGLVTRQIEGAQAKAEGYNFDIRKHVVQYDDVMNRQREVIYALRNKILAGEGTRERALDMLQSEVRRLAAEYTADEDPEEWNLEGLLRAVGALIDLPEDVAAESLAGQDAETIQEFLAQLVEEAYAAREEHVGSEDMRLIERMVMLNTIDTQWVEYLTSMEELRQGIGLRAYGQRDPLVEYKSEAYSLFQGLMESIEHEVASAIYRVSIVREQAPPIQQTHTNREETEPQARTKRTGPKVGRNDPCPCGSGRKYKKCHGAATL
jgi:preprotein translocase subunit SecA